jgi:hypothetical protein
MAGARQNTSQEYVLNLSKKIEQLMDSATQYNEDTIRLLSSIDTIQKDSVSVELKKHTKSLQTIQGDISKWGKLHYDALVSIERKIGPGGGGGGKGSMPDPKKLNSFFNVLIGAGAKAIVAVSLSLALVGKLGESTVQGARIIADAFKILLTAGKDLSLKDAAISVAAYGLINTAKIGKSVAVLAETGLTGFLFNFMLVDNAKYISEAVRILLQTGQGIDKSVALTSAFSYFLLSKSKLPELMQTLTSSFSLKEFIFMTNFSRTATGLKEAVYILLSASNDLSMSTVIKSLLTYKALANSDLPKLMEALTMSFGFFGNLFAGRKMRKRAEALRMAVATMVGARDAELGIEGKLTMGSVIKSVIMYGLLGLGLKSLMEALTMSFGFFGNMFAGKRMRKRAEALRNAVVILANIPKKIDQKTLMAGLISYVLLGLGVKLLVKPIIWAGLLAPLVWAGTRVIAGGVRRILGVMKSIKTSQSQYIGASIFLATLGTFIGGLLIMSTLAAIGAPLILLGTLTISLMLRGMIRHSKQIKKMGGKEELEKMMLLTSIIAAIITVTAAILGLSMKNGGPQMLINVGIFTIMAFALTFLVVKMSSTIKKSESAGSGGTSEAVKILVGSISVLVNAITLILISQFAADAKKSLTSILIFGTAMFVISFAVSRMIKTIGDTKASVGQIVALTILISAVVLLTMGVVLFAKTLSVMDLLNVGIFALISFGIVLLVEKATNRLKGDFPTIMKAVTGILIFVGGMILALIGIKMAASLVDPISLILFIGAVAVLSFVIDRIGRNLKDILKGGLAMLAIAFSIYVFSMALAVYKSTGAGLLDALVLGLSVAFLGLVFYLVGKGWVDILKGSLAMAAVGISLAFLSIGLFYYKAVNIGGLQTLLLILTVLGLGFAFKYIGKKAVQVAKGAAAMLAVSISIMLLSLGMKVWKSMNIGWKEIGTLGATVGMLGLEYSLFGKRAINVAKGAGAMMLVGVSVMLLAAGMKIWSLAKVKMKDIGVLGATILMLGVEMAAAGFGPAPVMIASGAAAMLVAGVAVILIATAMKIWTSAKAKMKDVGVLGATVGMIALEMAGAGFASPMILLGAAAMTVSGVAVILIATAMKIFTSAKVKHKDANVLGYTITTIADRMSSAGWSAITITAGAAAMIVAGAALLIIAKSVKIFSDAKFKPKDARDMKKSIGILIGAITMIGDDKALKAIGIEINYAKMDKGIARMNLMVKILNSFLYWAKSWKKQKDINKTVDQIKAFTGSFIEIFDPQKNQTLDRSDKYLTSFANNVAIMAKSADPLTKMANNMERIQKAMKLFKESINGMDLKKLTLTDSMLHSMALLSKNPEVLAERMRKSLETSFKELIKALKDLAGGQGSGSGTGTGGGGGGNLASFGAGQDNTTLRKGAGDSTAAGGITINDALIKAVKDRGGNEAEFRTFYLAMLEALNDSVITVRAANS